MLGRRPAGPGLEKSSSFYKGDDRKHFRAGAEFQDREQVGQIRSLYIMREW